MPNALIYGCNGALGAAVARHLRASMPAWNTIGVDLKESTDVHHSITVERAQAMFPSAQVCERPAKCVTIKEPQLVLHSRAQKRTDASDNLVARPRAGGMGIGGTAGPSAFHEFSAFSSSGLSVTISASAAI